MNIRAFKQSLTAFVGLMLATLSTQTWALNAGAPLAIDDAVVILEDSGTTVLCVLDNDTVGPPENLSPLLWAIPPLQSDLGWIAPPPSGPLQVGTTRFVRNGVAGCTTPVPANPARYNAIEVTVSANQNGTAIFYYGVEGLNGVQDFSTGGCGVQAAQSNSCGFVTVDVTPVNDPPTFTPGGSKVVSEDAGSQTVVGWASGMDEGGGTDEDSQNLSFVVVSNSNPALFAVQPAVDATTGTLTYRPADDQFGSANIRIVLQDDGGTANGGDDTSGQVVFSINVNGVPDDPVVPNDSFTIPEGNGANETDLDNETNLLSGVTDPDPFDTHVVNTTPVTPPSHALSFTLQAGGDFDYIHDDSENFSDSFTYRVEDSGGRSSTATVTITITEENDNDPVPAANSFTVLEGGSADETDLDSVVDNLLQGLTDVDTTDSHTVVTTPADDVDFGTLTLFTDGTFDYTHDGSENFVDSFDFEVEDAGGNTGIETVTITITPVNENDPVAVDDSFTVAEGGSANETVLDTFTNLLAGVTDIDTGDTFTVNTTAVNDVDFGTLVLQAGGDFDYTHDGSENLADSFEYEVQDAAGNTTTAEVFITVTGVNDDPVVTVPGAQNIDEDVQTAIGGISVSDTDADGGGGLQVTLEVDDGVLNVTPSGAAIVNNNDTDSVDVTGLVADVNATLASLLYTSDLNYYGAETLTVTANDGGNTGTGGGGDVVDTVAITVDPVNDTPIVSDITNQATSEDTTIAGIAFTTDEDDQGDLANENAQTVIVTATSSNQTLVPDANITVNFTDAGDAVGGTIDIVPAANQNGAVTITVTVDDGEATNNTVVDTFTLTINAVNDTPSIIDITNQSVDEDTDLTGLAFTVDEDDQGDLANENFQVVSVVGSSSNNGLVADSSITENFTDGGDAGGGTIDISPQADQNGTVTITITVNDGEALNNIVVDTFDLTINPVNDDPTIDPIGNQVTNEDVDVTGIPFVVDEGGGSDEDAQNLIVTATSSDQTVVANAGITVNYTADNAADATGGTIDISPFANGNGITTITVSVDDGISAPVTTDFTVTVNAQNDNPFVAAPFADVVVNEDAPNSVLDLAAVFDDVDIATNGDSLTLAITGNTNPVLFASIGLSGVSGAITNNTLTIDYAATLHGFSDITIEATDGGPLTITDTFRVTVNSVPDSPEVANPIADVNVIEEAADTVIDLTTVFDDEDILTDADTLTLSVLSNTNPTLFDSVVVSGASGAIINNTLTLDYAANQNGTADITVRATDILGATDDDTFTVTVTNVNDEPTFTIGADQASDEDAGAQTVPLFIADGSPGPADEAGQNLTYTVTNDNNGLFAVQPAISAAGQLTYTATTHLHGSATVSVFLSDDGGTANGGDDTSPVQTFDITINAVADVPTLTVNNAITTDEDVAASLGINTALVDLDGSETLTVQISGLPTGAELSDGTNTSSAAVTDVSAWTIAGITVIGAVHSDDDFVLTVTSTATETSNFDAEASVQLINVTVDGVADAPSVLIAPDFLFVPEDTESAPLPIGIISLVDTTNETLAISMLGLPAGAMIQDGTNSATSTGAPIDLTTWTVTNIRMTPPLDDSDDFVLTISATSTEVNHPTSTANTAETINVTVIGVADEPTLLVTPTAATDEDVAVSLSVSGAVVDPSETLTFNISGVPIGAVLSGGTDSGGGVWTGITPAEAATLTITPALHSAADFTLTVESQATDDVSTETSDPETIDVTVNAVADVPTMAVVTPATGDEDTAIPLTVTTALVDGDGSETLSIVVTGVITGGTLSAGTDLGGGTWSLTPAQLAGLTLSLPAHVADDFQVEFQATSTEADNADTALTNVADGRIAVIFNDIADTPNATFPASYATNEDTNVVLGLTGGLVDTDGSETFYLEVTKVGDGGTISLSTGTEISTNVWRLTEAQIPGAELILDADNNDDFTLNLSFVAEETDGGDTATVDTSIPVSVTAINDPPIASDLTVSIDENTVNGTVVGTVSVINVEPVGLEPNQTLTFVLPGTAFAIDTSGVITVADETQLDFETTPVFNLVATVTDSGAPAQMDTANVTISLNSLNEEVPVAVADVVAVDELATVNLNVLDNDSDGDMPPNLSVAEVMGNPALVGMPIVLQTGGIDAGTLTVNSDGTATFVTNPDNTVEVYDAAALYTLTDGDNDVTDVDITITINPINDNMPMLTAAGSAYTGETYNEDDPNPKTIILNPFFSDLDIDDDGILDGSTIGDQDSLVFSIVSNSNSALIAPSINGGDLELTTPTHGHGTSTIVVRATDTAAPAGNISSVDLSFDVVVTSENDAPVYSVAYYVDQTLDEDPTALNVDLDGAFTDADLSDLNPTDDSLTYTVTIIDQPNAYVQSGLIDESGLAGAVVTNDSPVVGQRTIVYTTTASSFALAFNADAHGQADITVRATDDGVPPELPSAPIPLFDEGTFSVTVNSVGDDQPIASDYHYSTYPALIVDEDGDPIIFNPTENDYHGDAPVKVIQAGAEYTDSFSFLHRYRSQTRMADPQDTGTFQIEANGEVSCSEPGCQDLETADTTVDGSSLLDFQVIYKPLRNFNGEDSFDYCIEDSAPAGEATFTGPPGDPRCGTVTVLVNPTNDLPEYPDPITFVMTQADDLILTSTEGLLSVVKDPDNTHIDGLGCNPLLPSCVPGPSDPQPDRLYFRFQSALTDHGQLLPPFLDDGSFQYRPDPTFAGEDSFLFDVCDVDTAGLFDDTDRCILGIQANILIEPLSGAASGSSDDAVQFDFQLADQPLELPVGPEPNVLIITDDSGSMNWDILTDQSNGLYYFETGDYV
ncbi:MAG: Ig-like domain-containing protein, partial [Pseudomonadota bacterium]